MKHWAIIAPILVFFVMSCATGSGSILITGTPRTPIAIEEVTLYTSPPSNYEVIGIVNASSDAGWSQQGSLDYAVEHLKKEAANVGANGVLIKNQGLTSGDTVGFVGDGGMYYGSSVEKMQISGEAIWVAENGGDSESGQ